MERRVQLLLDPAQYAQVEVIAEREGKSVSAVIREAIGQRLTRNGDLRAVAAARLLSSTDEGEAAPIDWQVEKEAMERQLDRASK